MAKLETKNDKALKLFFIIVIGISIAFEAAIIYLKAMGLAAILMWVPAIAAFVVKQKYYKGEKGFLGFRLCRIKYIIYAIVIPLIYIGVPYVIYWIMYPDALIQPIDTKFFCMLVIGIPIGMITAIGEEIGWRGFMVPALLKKIGLNKTLLLSSLIWGTWHLPILISGLYMPGTPIYFKVPMFMLMIMATGSVIALITLQSKSVWPATVMHAAHNSFDQMVFGGYTNGSDQMYFVSETGVFTIIIGVIIAILFYISVRRKNSVLD